MRYLITGANGFIGRSLTKFLLKNGHFVYAVVTNKNDMEELISDNLVIIEAYFEDYDKIIAKIDSHGIDCLFHLAWQGLAGEKAYDVETQLNNVLVISKLLNDLAKVGLRKVVLASTMNKLEVMDSIIHPGLHPLRRISVHVASKINAEIVSRVFCQTNSIQFNDALIAMAYGENNKSKMITNIFISNLLKGQSPKLIKGDNPYDLIYIDDIVKGLYAIATKGVDTKTYYIGHSFDKSFKQWFTEIGNIVNNKIPLQFGAFPEDNHLNFGLIDRTLLTADTGWKPETDFVESIEKTARWIASSNIEF